MQHARFLLTIAIVAATVIAALCSSALVSATAPPHGHKPFKKDDPRLVHDHTLGERIEHVFDVRADSMRHYLRPVKDTPNRVTLMTLYSAWCGDACNKWVPVLKEVALMMREAEIQHRFSMLKHEVTRNDIIAQKLGIEAFPAIGLIEAADHRDWKFIKYEGPADASSVIAFIEQNSPEHAAEHAKKLRVAHANKQ